MGFLHDRFDHNLEEAIDRFIDQFDIEDSVEDIIKEFNEGYDNTFKDFLIDIAHEYMDINELLRKALEERE